MIGEKKKIVVEDIISSNDDEIEPKTKAAAVKLNAEVKDCDEFAQWFPSSLLPKPARSPVCTLYYLICQFHFTNF